MMLGSMTRAPLLRLLSPLVLCGVLAACGDDSTVGTGGGGGATSSSGSPSSSSDSTSTPASSGSTTSSGNTTSSAGGSGGSGQGGSGQGGSGQGGSGQGGSGQGGSGGAGQGGDLPAFGDDCDSNDDCFGGECVEVNGHRTCRVDVTEATACENPQFDECCDTSECADPSQICTIMPDAYCGGAKPNFYNQCVSTDDTCADLDCGKGDAACAPPGTFGFSAARCVTRYCHEDGDCNEGPGGSCVPIDNPCCGSTSGFFCAYADDGCRSTSDCGEGTYCEPNFATGVASCVPGVPACPA